MERQSSSAAQTPIKVGKKIRKRTITHGKFKACQKNQNCPKFVIATCWLWKEEKIVIDCEPSQEDRVLQTYDQCWKWMEDKTRDKINLDSLKAIFGEHEDPEVAKRNYVNSKLFYRFLKNHAHTMVASCHKVTKPLSYLMCLEKYTARLGNPRIADRLQYR